MKIKTLIVEDEPIGLERLSTILNDINDIEIVETATNGKMAIEKINKLKPELVFLDIHLPEISGIELLKKINFKPNIIFVTAYDKYAVKAFEENAIDYVLKPYSKERIINAIEKLKNKTININTEILEKIDNIFKEKEFFKRFTVRMGDKINLISENEVVFFQAEDKYVMLNTNSNCFLTDFTLKDLEKKVDHKKFIRIHKSNIINIDKVKSISKWFNGQLKIEMDDSVKTVLTVSRKYVHDFKKMINL